MGREKELEMSHFLDRHFVEFDNLIIYNMYRVFFSLVPPLKVESTEMLIYARLGVSRPIYVNVDSPNLGFPYFNFLGGYQLKKNTL